MVITDISEEAVRDVFQGQRPGTFYFISLEKKSTAWYLGVVHQNEFRLHNINFSVTLFLKILVVR